MGGYNSGGGRGALKESALLKLDMANFTDVNLGVPCVQRYTNTWRCNGHQTGQIDMLFQGHQVTLSYRKRHYEDWEDVQETMRLIPTYPNFGGVRWWIECLGCRQKKRVLWGNGYFRCGKCWRMTYESQYESTAENIISRAQDQRRKMNGDVCLSFPFPTKPKGMHWRTYNKLVEKDWRALEVQNAVDMAFLSRYGGPC